MKYPATILITGGTGLIGNAVIQRALTRGSIIYCTTRCPHRSSLASHPQIHYIEWDGTSEITNLPSHIDAVVNLAGENIAARRWSAIQKRRIVESRITTTERLVNALKRLEKPPKTFLSASAIGFYGDRPGEQLFEKSSVGESFLSSVCQRWELAAQEAAQWSATVSLLRFGVVLSRDGGALKKMLSLFRFGLGGILGNGKQYMSWISLNDVTRAIDFLLENPIPGAVNVTSPCPCTNRELTSALAATLHRPAVFPLPAAIIKILLGQMGEELLLSSARVIPSHLSDNGFSFTDQRIADFLTRELKT